jgi:hypothetical protein
LDRLTKVKIARRLNKLFNRSIMCHCTSHGSGKMCCVLFIYAYKPHRICTYFHCMWGQTKYYQMLSFHGKLLLTWILLLSIRTVQNFACFQRFKQMLRTGRQGDQFRSPREAKEDFFSSLCVQTGSETHQPPVQWVPFLGGKARLGRDADHSTQYNAEVVNG